MAHHSGGDPMLNRNIQRLQHFITVVQAGSISKAAVELNMSQPALTKSLQRLEDTIGATLLDRTPRGVEPTELGTALASRIRVILAEVRHAEEEIEALCGSMAGSIRVGAGPSIIDKMLPLAINEFAQRHADVRFIIREGLVEQLLQSLAAAEIDIAIVSNSRTADPDIFVSTPVLRDDLSVVTGPDHPLARMGHCNLEVLLQYRWVLPERSEPIRHRFEDVFRSVGLRTPSPVIETNSASCMKSLARYSGLVTWLPHILVAQECQEGVLAAIGIDDMVFRRQVYICQRKNAVSLPLHENFLAALKTTFNKVLSKET